MDFSKFSDQDMQAAYESAVAKDDMPNALLFQGELNKRRASVSAETGAVEQGLGGIYEGLASGFGAPVDIAAAGLRKIGVPVGDSPLLGSESLKSALQGVSMGQAIPEADPQTLGQKMLRGGGKAIGEAAAATTGVIAAAPKLKAVGDSAYDAFKAVLQGTRKEAIAAPAAFAGTEAALSGAGGSAGAAISEIFPESPTAKMIAEILGASGAAIGVKSAERLLAKKFQGPLTSSDLKNEAGYLYNDQRDAGLSAPPKVTQTMYDNALSKANAEGIVLPDGKIDPDMPKMKAVMKFLESYAGKEMGGANILQIRKVISGRLNDAKGSERNAIRGVLREFDANTAELAPNIKVANAMYARAMKADQIEEMVELAKKSGRARNGDMEGAYRDQFAALSRRIIKGQESGWSKSEIDNINQIVEGGTLENILTRIGKLQPSGAVSAATSLGVPFGLSMQVTGDPFVSGTVAAGVGGLGIAGRQMAGGLQKQNIDNLYQSMIQGRNMTPAAEQRLKAALTTYLSGQAATE